MTRYEVTMNRHKKRIGTTEIINGEECIILESSPFHDRFRNKKTGVEGFSLWQPMPEALEWETLQLVYP